MRSKVKQNKTKQYIKIVVVASSASSLHKFLCLCGFFFIYFSFLPQAKDIQVRFYDNSKFL